MSIVLPGAILMGHNRLAPCSLVLPDDRFPEHTDWFGSPTKRIVVQHQFEQPQQILAQRQSSVGTYNVFVGRFDNDILILYFGQYGWMSWQSGIDLRRPFRPHDLSIQLFFATFLCARQAKRVLIIGLGGGVLPILIRHYFPSILIDVVEIDETVIELSLDIFGLAEQTTDGHLNIIADDGFRYVKDTVQRYDMIFTDAFNGDVMPAHMNTEEYFINVRNILNDGGCLATNANFSITSDFDRLTQALTSTFDANILLAHNLITENARVIISGNRATLTSIDSKEHAIQAAQRLDLNVHFEFSLSKLLSLAYRGSLNDSTSNN
ncbi:unnamed protein product [Rotaria sp. Silwood1]|nr:unnamed protein product [Rotaria sp. Silwood1]